MNKNIQLKHSSFIILLFIGLIVSLFINFPNPAYAQTIPAFPGAEGFGANTVGGRGGRVYEVTNLNDFGAGSLRDCINASAQPSCVDSNSSQANCARICIFRVGGTITVQSTVEIRKPYITIAGQTASGGGISLRMSPSYRVDPVFESNTHDVVVRYLTVRAGSWFEADAMNTGPSNNKTDNYNLVFDHCSFSWGTDQIFATWYRPYNMTFQWNIFTEGLDCATHSKGCHSKGPMLGSYAAGEGSNTPGAYNISFHHNLTTNSRERTPLIKTAGTTDVVNNLTYDSGSAGLSHVDMEHQLVTIPVNFVGNFVKGGPSSNSTLIGIKVTNVNPPGAQIYLQNNKLVQRGGTIVTGDAFLESGAQQYKWPTRHSAAQITTTSPDEAYNQVLAMAGNYQGLDANGNWYTRRDAVDKRVVNEVKTGRGKIIDAPWANSCLGACRGAGYYLTINDYNYSDISPSEINQSDGYPVISSGTPYPDSDHDGMSDAWETRYSFNPNSAVDGPQDADSDGYTNLEEFLNGTNPRGTSPLPTQPPTATSTPVPSQYPGDLNSDGHVNGSDLLILFQNWGNSIANDPNRDNKINSLDFGLLIRDWGK